MMAALHCPGTGSRIRRKFSRTARFDPDLTNKKPATRAGGLLVDQDGKSLHQFFDTLDDWNHVLEPSLKILECENECDDEDYYPPEMPPKRPLPPKITKFDFS